MSSKRDSIVPDVDNYSRDDLIDVYNKLAESYRQLKRENEENKQELHSVRQQTRIFLRSQNDLQSELEGINEVHRKEIEAIQKTHAGIIDALKKSKQEIENEKIEVEKAVDELSRKIIEQNEEIEELRVKLVNKKPAPRISDSFSINLEVEIESLKEKLLEVHGKLEVELKESHEKDSQIDELREKVLCLEDNLESKKNEMEEKNEAMESLQEQLNEMTVEIAMLKSAPEESNRKGNSLFAEVDDQRQKMKWILKNERAHYCEMKKIFNAKEMEIRRLKRENQNIKTEIQTCSGLLRRGEQIEVQTMSNQVAYLYSENRKLTKEMMEMEKKLKDLASEQNLGWIESLMTSATFETRDLKEKLMREMMEKTSLSDNFARAQRDLAKVRLDCVKLKILLGRIVDVNGIKISENDFLDIDIDREVLEGLKIEEIESVEEPKSPESDEALNESTIILLGGRERLGNLIPKPEKLDFEAKENFDQSPVNKPSISPQNEPLKAIPVPQDQVPHVHLQDSQKEKEQKAVKFSNNIETKIIDATQEKFEESKQARKRNPIVVKRIVIASKTAKKVE